MTMRKIAATAALLAVGSIAFAGQDVEKRVDIRLEVVEGDEPVSIAFSSDDLDFDPMALQVGESRSIVTDDGRSVLLTRTDGGLSLNIDGRDIELPGFGDIGMSEDDIAALEIEHEHAVHDVSVDGAVFISDGDTAGITIVSDDAIDAATRESIRGVLQSAGYDSEVRFIDTTSAAGAHHVEKVIHVRKL